MTMYTTFTFKSEAKHAERDLHGGACNIHSFCSEKLAYLVQCVAILFFGNLDVLIDWEKSFIKLKSTAYTHH